MLVDSGSIKIGALTSYSSNIDITELRNLSPMFDGSFICTIEIDSDTDLLVVGAKAILTDGDGVEHACVVSHIDGNLAYINLDE